MSDETIEYRQVMLDSTQFAPYRELAQVMSRYRQRATGGKVVDYKDYAELKVEIDSIREHAGTESWALLWEMVDTYLDNSVKTGHPQYFNQLWAGHSEQALIGGVIELLANTSMYTFEVAPVATVVENELRNTFAQHFGLHGWESQMTTGGSNSNFLALLLALHRRFPQYKSKGVATGAAPRIYVSEESHYSIDKAVMMAGLGLQSLVKVPVDERGAMQTTELRQAIVTDRENGYEPLLILATAGTTVRGAFDAIDEISSIANTEHCWLHVDGAWGGALGYATNGAEQLLNGLERADSFSWDAHKMLGVPLMCSLLFVRQVGALKSAFQLGDTSYIFHDNDASADLGPASLQCGRRVDALKMWLEYLYYGAAGFSQRINQFLALSAHAEERIKTEPELELQTYRWINNICFRSRPEGVSDTDELNRFNQAVRSRLRSTGQTLVNQAYIGDALTIRLIIANKNVDAEDISRFFDQWIETSNQLKQELTS